MKYNLTNGKKIIAALIAAGAKPDLLPWLMSQIAHETAGFNSKVLNTDNNASGIMFINKPAKQRNATRGSSFPKKEGKYYYARFATLKDWAVDYLRIIGKVPQTATSLLDLATKLRARNYYTDTVANYAKGLNFHYKNIKDMFSDHVPSTSNNNLPLIVGSLILLAYFAA